MLEHQIAADALAVQSVESRESTALALVAFSRSVASNALSARLGPNYKQLLARLLQDDDVVVRGHARDAYGSRLIEAKAVEEILKSGGQDLRDALLREEEVDLCAPVHYARCSST